MVKNKFIIRNNIKHWGTNKKNVKYIIITFFFYALGLAFAVVTRFILRSLSIQESCRLSDLLTLSLASVARLMLMLTFCHCLLC